jgi:hypothetical protein
MVVSVSLAACGDKITGKYKWERNEETVVFKADTSPEIIQLACEELGFEYEEGRLTYTKTDTKKEGYEQYIELKKDGKAVIYSKYEDTEQSMDATYKKDGDKLTITYTEEGDDEEEAEESTIELKYSKGELRLTNDTISRAGDIVNYIEYATSSIVFKM